MRTDTMRAVVTAALGALCSYFLQLMIPLIVLVAVVLLDYVTGMSKAWVKGELSSRVGLKGILKKLSYFVIVGVAGAMDWLITYGLTSVGIEWRLPFLLASIVICWLIINELISILENVAAIGGPVPEFLKALLGKLKTATEEKAGGEKHDGV